MPFIDPNAVNPLLRDRDHVFAVTCPLYVRSIFKGEMLNWDLEKVSAIKKCPL